MTTNQTIDGVSRDRLISGDLLERLANAPSIRAHGQALDELRALLDEPVIAICRGCFTEQPMGRACKTCAEVEAKRAAQPQVEPVAYRYKEAHAAWEDEKPWEPTTLAHGAVLLERKVLAANGTFRGDERDHYLALKVEPLYAEQPAPKYNRAPISVDDQATARLVFVAREAAISSAHRYSYMPTTPEDALLWEPHPWVIDAMRMVEHPAPVAVVLPDRPRADEEEYERMTDYEKGLLHGGIELWDKIDEVTRLNPSL